MASFSELSDRAKDTARDAHRYADVEHNDWWDSVYEDAVRMGELLGITIGTCTRRTTNNKEVKYTDINFSGFCSQGDGACFAGRYAYAPDAHAKISTETDDEELRRIAAELTSIQVALKLLYGTTAEIGITSGSSNYCHSNTMEFAASFADCDDGDMYALDPDTEKQLCQLVRDFADWIYAQLEAEHDYLTSDEHLDQYLTELEFDEDGNEIT